ncbi:MAG TPA: hypothetical protein PKY81_13770 [bacterium]|nr:hypothetical protein [bacterium]
MFLNLNIFVKMQPSVNRYFFGLARYIFVVVETINGNLVCRHFSGFYLNPTISFLVSAIVLIYIFYIYFVKLKNKTDLDYLSLITFFSIVILAPFLKEVFQNQGSFNHIFTHRYLIIISVPFSIILGRVIGYLLFSKKNLYVLFSIILLIYYPFIFIYNYIIPFEKYGGKFKTSSGYSWNLQSTLIRNDYGEVQFLISNEGQPLEIALKKIIKDNELKKIILDDFYMSNIIEFYSKIHKVNYPIYKLPNPPKSQLTTNFSIETLINSNINIDEVTLYIFSYNKTNYHFSSFLNLNFDETMLLTPYFIVLKKDGSELLNVYKIKLSKLIYKNLLLKK